MYRTLEQYTTEPKRSDNTRVFYLDDKYYHKVHRVMD